LIVVSVTMDTVAQVQGYLLAHQYEGLIRKSKLRGRRRWRWNWRVASLLPSALGADCGGRWSGFRNAGARL